ncbi:MAG: FHA domain-containing protein [Kofleriaceae bacterium]
MLQVTNKVSDGELWAINDPVVRLRVWGDEQAHGLPAPPINEWVIGAGADTDLQLQDASASISRRHARLERDGVTWTLHDLGSTNGIREDGERRLVIELAPGIEVEIGTVRLIAESERLKALHAVLARLIGWGAARRAEVDSALRATREMASRRAALVLCGDGQLIGTARRLHALAVGAERPFVVCDASDPTALVNATAGTLCIVGARDPEAIAVAARTVTALGSKARIIICGPTRALAVAAATPMSRIAVIELPPLGSRTDEMQRLIVEYASDAVSPLGTSKTALRDRDPEWLAAYGLKTLHELEEDTYRLVALRNWSVTAGAARLGISHVALSRWARRRNIPT